MDAKPVSDLTPEDFTRSPVWEFDNANETQLGRDETWVIPVRDLPVTSLSNRVVAVTLQFNGREVLGMLGNIDLHDLRATREFATLSVWHGGSWFHLPRYFDPGYERDGPGRLPECLGLPRDEVFPILYDLSGAAVGHPEVVRGRIDDEPRVRLTEEERMDLIFDRLRNRASQGTVFPREP